MFCAALMASGAFMVTTVPSAAAQERQFDVPAQPAGAAISALAHQARIQVIAARAFTKGKWSAPVRGAMTVEQALERLLQGTELMARQKGPQTYLIVPVPTASNAVASAYQPAGAVGGDEVGNADNSLRDGSGDEASSPDIVVTGVRASLRSAQAIKRNASQVVDSIVAEDIGKLPDRNVAEALQRIPGIQIQRAYGEGRSVAIRGLTQVRTELNGRDIFTASGVNQLSLEDVPSELLAGIDVYKNPSSDLIEDQLSGVINFRTRKAFDFDGFKASASVSNDYYDLIQRSRPAASLLLSNRWDTGIGEIGVLANISYQKTAFRQDVLTTQPFYMLDQSLRSDGTPNNPTDYATASQLGRLGQPTTLAHGGGFNQYFGDRRRLGIDLSVQWRPSSTLEITGELFRNNYKFRYDDYAFQAYTGDASITPLPGAPFSYGENGDFESGVFQNVPVGSFTSLETRRSITTDYSLNLKWTPTANLTVTADGQYVRSTTNYSRLIMITNSVAPTLSYDVTGSRPSIAIGPEGFVENPANYSNGGFLDNFVRSLGTDKSGRLDAEYRFDGGFLQSIKAGLRYSERRNSSRDTGYRYTGLSGPVTDYSRTDLNDFFRGDADIYDAVISFPRSLIVDYDATRAALGIGTTPAFLPSGRHNESQKNFAAYVAAFFKADDAPIPIDGNIGGRIVRTEQNAAGFYQQTPQVTLPNGTQTNGTPTFNPIAFDQSYTKFLPSVNVRAHLADNLQLRLAASVNLARPSFAQLNPSLSIVEPGRTQQNEIHSASGGNPELRPMTSRNIDMSLEWYFSRTGSLTLAGFYKNIKNYIQTAVATRPITFTSGQTYDFDVTSYLNAENARVKGVEVAYQQFFDFLPGPLGGLGVQANFTYVDSSAPSPAVSGPVTSVPLEKLSKYSYNLVGIYERGKLSARLAYNWRSKFVDTTSGNGTGNLPLISKSFGQLDGSVSLNVTPRLTLTLEGRNLTNTQFNTYYGLPSRPRDAMITDRRISGIARVTF
jgi:TonB-dependent receptor